MFCKKNNSQFNQRGFVLAIILVINTVLYVIAQPIALHPDNPHYFQYKNQPAILISSAEHYGAVINGAFDYNTYLKTLHHDGMNYTRIFTGSYLEMPGAFGIAHNTLAPQPKDLIMPWKQVDEMGKFPGDRKYDLNSWNPDYFKRLHDFVKTAEELDIIVEVTFFSSNYTYENWDRNPFNNLNSINNLSSVDRKLVNTLDNGNIFEYQKKYVRKIVEELNQYDNIVFEIQNEPWSDQIQDGILFHKTIVPGGSKGDRMSQLANEKSLKWQIEIANLISNTEESLLKSHLIAQNYCNIYHPLKEINANISILNFHYAWPEAAYLNYGWEKPISFDESGFSEKSGMGNTTYLRQAWEFVLAGGAIFNNLDYSFYCGSENGTLKNKAPGGGGSGLRKQLKLLHSFIYSFDFIKMKPDFDIVYHAPGMRAQALSEKGKQYAIVFTELTNDWVKLKLPKGKYTYSFYSPFSGDEIQQGSIKSNGEVSKWEIPENVKYLVALKLIRQ